MDIQPAVSLASLSLGSVGIVWLVLNNKVDKKQDKEVCAVLHKDLKDVKDDMKKIVDATTDLKVDLARMTQKVEDALNGKER